MSDVSASVVTPSAAAWVDQDHDGANHGGTPSLRMDGTSSHAKQSLIFIGRPFPLDAAITSALLRLTLAGDWSGQTLTVQRITDSWKERQVDWASKPASTSTHEATLAITGSAGQERELDITPMMADVATGGDFHGFLLKVSGTTERRVYGPDASIAEYQPEFEVEWREPPEPPDNLSPGGGLATSLTKPVLSWQWGDRGIAAAQEQADSQVQVSTSTDFSSPSYDSDWQANTDSSWDLSATPVNVSDDTFSALADDAVRYWRVRVRDDAGQESDWSDATQFTRKSKGALTITAPADAPDNFVEETTPPLIHTFSGRTQESVRRRVYEVRDDDSLRLQWDSGRMESAGLSYTLPAGILQTGPTYRYVVTAWDTIDRQETQGDSPWVEASKDFTYERGGTPAPVDTLTATPDGAKVVLEWTRTLAPDAFCIVVDGVEVQDEIDPADVLVSGTTYRYEFCRAKPRVNATYEVEAVEDTAGVFEHSDGNPTAMAQTNPVGKWLIDEADGLAVCIEGRQQSDVSIRESATTHDIPGARVPVRITDSIGGFAGNTNGDLPDPDTCDDFLALKGRDTDLRFIEGPRNIPIRLEEVSGPVASAEVPGDRNFIVGFAWFQSGEVDDAFDWVGA